MTLSVVALAPMVASLIAGMVIPSIVDFVTHSSAPWWMKSVTATGLSALAGVLTTVTWSPSQDWKIYILNIFTAFVATFASHQAGSSQVVESATAGFGLFKQSSVPVVSGQIQTSDAGTRATVPPPTTSDRASLISQHPSSVEDPAIRSDAHMPRDEFN